MLQNYSSAAVVIGTLRVNIALAPPIYMLFLEIQQMSSELESNVNKQRYDNGDYVRK